MEGLRPLLRVGVEDYQPDCLVIDIRGLNFGPQILEALVGAAHAMRRLGEKRQTRLLAAGEKGEWLDKVIRLTKVESLFRGKVFADLDSALGKTSGSNG